MVRYKFIYKIIQDYNGVEKMRREIKVDDPEIIELNNTLTAVKDSAVELLSQQSYNTSLLIAFSKTIYDLRKKFWGKIREKYKISEDKLYLFDGKRHVLTEVEPHKNFYFTIRLEIISNDTVGIKIIKFRAKKPVKISKFNKDVKTYIDKLKDKYAGKKVTPEKALSDLVKYMKKKGYEMLEQDYTVSYTLNLDFYPFLKDESGMIQ